MKVFARDVHKELNVKKTFTSSEIKEKVILDIIHSYVCGPMSSISLSRYVYYVSFIDDFSHKTWIYFKEFKSLVENHTGRKIKTLRSDNVEEFTSKEFKDLCRESWIKRELITPYNPQQNGVAK